MAETLETGWLPGTPVDDTVLRRFLHSQADVNDVVALASGGKVDRPDAVALADAGGAVPFFNQAVLLRPLVDAGDTVLDAVEAFAPSDRPSTLISAWPTPDLAPRGWWLVGHPALVVRSPGPVPDSGRWAVAPGVEIREVTTAEDLAVAERVFIDGYPLPWAQAASPGAVLPPGVLDAGMRVRIADVDGEPAAVGLGHVGHGIVNLCGGAALATARRRGAWSALVRARVLDAPDLPAVAYTSDDSRPGFIALGFLPITRFTLWGRGAWG